MYWYSLLDIPAPSEFPGTGAKGNKMPDTMKSQAQFVDTVKEQVPVLSFDRLARHSRNPEGVSWIRPMTPRPPGAMRTQAGQAMEYMATAINSIGPDKVYEVFFQMDRQDRSRRIAVRQT